jgi:cellulose synthase operon protein C
VIFCVLALGFGAGASAASLDSGSTDEASDKGEPGKSSTGSSDSDEDKKSKHQAAAPEKKRSPLEAHGLRSLRPDYSADELDELSALGIMVKRFEKNAAEYSETSKKMLEHKYQTKRSRVHDLYEGQIALMESDQRKRRVSAIEKLEHFVERYPDNPVYTPDVMFRLSELYFERSYDEYFLARRDFDKNIDSWDSDSGEPEPEEPTVHYESTIGAMQKLVTDFPNYRLVDGAYYLLGYCLGEQGEEAEAASVFEELVAARPDSRFAPEVWTRIGEYYFNTNDLERALHGYSQVLGSTHSPFYDKALYKLAWTHYRLADPDDRPDEFQKAVDTFIDLLEFNVRTKEEGKERGRDLRNESVQYIAISYSEDGWGSFDKMKAYVASNGERPYTREMLTSLGDVYFDQTKFAEAVQAYLHVQERYPNSSEAPDIQEKIVNAFERERNFEAAANARTQLNQRYSEGSDWFKTNADNPDALARAKKLTEKSLYAAALFHHKQAQVHKDAGKLELSKEQYELAAGAYSKYLTRFPHDKQLYDLTFYLAECQYYSLQFTSAAANYMKIRDATIDDKFRDDAAFSTFLAFENAIKVAEVRGELTKPGGGMVESPAPGGEVGAPLVEGQKQEEAAGEKEAKGLDIPELRLKLITAGDTFRSLVPKHEETPKLMYKAAETYYDYKHLLEARKRFLEILEEYPDQEVAKFSANLVIETYLAQDDFIQVEKFSAGLLESSSPAIDKDFRKELIKFRSGAMFKIAESLAEKKKYDQAGAMYLKLVKLNPKSEFADLALNNAAVQNEQSSRFDTASKLYERLVNEYPESALADTALFRVALNAERFFSFDKAISTYLKLVKNYPESTQRADAIYNVALSLESTQQYKASARQYLRYCDLFPDRDDAPAVCFRAGSVYEKMGDPKLVISTYRNFIKKYKSNDDHSDRIMEAYLLIAKAYLKLNKRKDVMKAYKAAVDFFAKKSSKKSNEKSAPYAAEAQFRLYDPAFKKFMTLRFVGNAKKQQKMLLKKAEVLKEVETKYKGILKFKQFDWTLASLYRIGQLYQNFAESMTNADCPPDVKRQARSIGVTPEEVCDEYAFLLEEKAVALEDKAVEAFETTLNKAREFQVANDWTKKTLLALNKLRAKLWPLQKDAKRYLDPDAPDLPPVFDASGSAIGLPKEEPPVVSKDTAPQDEQDKSTSEAKKAQPQSPSATPLTPPAKAGSTAEPASSQVPAPAPPPPPPATSTRPRK